MKGGTSIPYRRLLHSVCRYLPRELYPNPSKGELDLETCCKGEYGKGTVVTHSVGSDTQRWSV